MRLESSIQWKKEADTWHLTCGEDHLVSLGPNKQGVRSFYLESRSFRFIQKSIWTTQWKIVNERNEQLMELKFGFWSGKGKARFNDGSVFECSYKTLPKFSFDIKDLRYGEKIISYHIDTTSGQSIPKLILHKREMFTDKLLFLLSLGMALLLQMFESEMDFTTYILLTTA
ncbi:MAG: hypothetical protein JJU28_06655 [Cyclobacteriaceae bacterium]|nr:hypothetical protein [Cyclobacteriaceae bacterium]